MTETTRHDLELLGCTPEPLMAYLKALGILRLVSEQKDAAARGWWKNDTFRLRSTLDRYAMAQFFLETYQPTPLVAPWNAGSGFYLKWDEKKKAFKERDASKAVSEIESSVAARFRPYRDQIAAIKKGLKARGKEVEPQKQIEELYKKGKDEGWSGKKTKSEIKKLLDGQMLFSADGSTFVIEKADKDDFLRDMRSSLLNDAGLRWIDAAFVIQTGHKKNRIEAPLLGSGGNIGNSDFSARFMQILTFCLPLNDGNNPSGSAVLLEAALFGSPTDGLKPLAVDQFDPGRAGGSNMYQGMEADFRLNPWDYILMLEGAVVFQSASSKRFGMGAAGAAFPFSVESTPGGFASSGPDITRGEQWLPLWSRASTALEIETMLAEGRSDVGHRQARNGVDFARSAASLGVDRGVSQFVRVQYQARFGDNYLANVLGRVDTLPRESVDLLRQIDPWLDSFRRAAGEKTAPPRFSSALRAVDSAIFDFCKYGGGTFFQKIVVALGSAHRELSITEQFREAQKLRPLTGLSYDWLHAANDDSAEFAVARALASIHDPQRKIGPLRVNLESVDWKKDCRAWAEKDRAVVWNAADLSTNLANVLQRRMMDGQRAGCECLPLASHMAVPLDIIAAFIAGELDDQRIEDLIWGLMLINPSCVNGRAKNAFTPPAVLPRHYALLKFLFLPGPLAADRRGDSLHWRLARDHETGISIRPEPRILSLLRAGRVGEACTIAARRLRASGLPPIPGSINGVLRDSEWLEYPIDHRGTRRLAAALLMPISSDSINELVRLVCRDQSAAVQTLAVSAEGESE